MIMPVTVAYAGKNVICLFSSSSGSLGWRIPVTLFSGFLLEKVWITIRSFVGIMVSVGQSVGLKTFEYL